MASAPMGYDSAYKTLPSENSFVHFQFPPNTFDHQDPILPYEMIVYKYRGELFYFGHCVARCLEFPKPHEAMKLVRAHHRDLSAVSGIFLKQDGIRALAGHAPVNGTSFMDWLHMYEQLNIV